jgi:hypothetical protein
VDDYDDGDDGDGYNTFIVGRRNFVGLLAFLLYVAWKIPFSVYSSVCQGCVQAHAEDGSTLWSCV